MTAKHTILFIIFLWFGLVGDSVQGLVVHERPDITLGRVDAPVTIIEYSSLSCDHCRDFHRETLPILKKKYIDTGKVRFIFRHFPLDNKSLYAATVVSTLPQEKRYEVLTKIFENQDKWLYTNSLDRFVTRLASIVGIEEKLLKQYVNDRAIQDLVLNQRLSAQKNFKVEAAPTFFINGTLFEGAPSLEELAEVIETATSHMG